MIFLSVLGGFPTSGVSIVAFLLLFELYPILILLLFGVFMVFGDDFKFVDEDLVSIKTIFVDIQ